MALLYASVKLRQASSSAERFAASLGPARVFAYLPTAAETMRGVSGLLMYSTIYCYVC